MDMGISHPKIYQFNIQTSLNPSLSFLHILYLFCMCFRTAPVLILHAKLTGSSVYPLFLLSQNLFFRSVFSHYNEKYKKTCDPLQLFPIRFYTQSLKLHKVLEIDLTLFIFIHNSSFYSKNSHFQT